MFIIYPSKIINKVKKEGKGLAVVGAERRMESVPSSQFPVPSSQFPVFSSSCFPRGFYHEVFKEKTAFAFDGFGFRGFLVPLVPRKEIVI